MIESSDFRITRIPLNNGDGHMPALGFGTLIPDAAVTISATRGALEAGFRHFDCAERYRNEREVGEALQTGLAAEGFAREDLFVTTKLWNSNHRPERVEPAFEASLERLIYESARIKPAVVQVEAHPYLPETELLEFCKEKGIVFLAFAPLGHGIRPGPLEDPVIVAIAERIGKTPAQVLLAWAVQRGTALLTTPRTGARAKENFSISALPEDAFEEINRIQTRQMLNDVVRTGSPGFIPQGT
jgi:diketogulonate reductase-like aldo/keto reductase